MSKLSSVFYLEYELTKTSFLSNSVPPWVNALAPSTGHSLHLLIVSSELPSRRHRCLLKVRWWLQHRSPHPFFKATCLTPEPAVIATNGEDGSWSVLLTLLVHELCSRWQISQTPPWVRGLSDLHAPPVTKRRPHFYRCFHGLSPDDVPMSPSRLLHLASAGGMQVSEETSSPITQVNRRERTWDGHFPPQVHRSDANQLPVLGFILARFFVGEGAGRELLLSHSLMTKQLLILHRPPRENEAPLAGSNTSHHEPFKFSWSGPLSFRKEKIRGSIVFITQ